MSAVIVLIIWESLGEPQIWRMFELGQRIAA